MPGKYRGPRLGCFRACFLRVGFLGVGFLRVGLLWAGLFVTGPALGWGVRAAYAQALDPCRVSTEPLLDVLPGQIRCSFVEDHQEADDLTTLSPGRSFLYSALVPGLAQHKQGKGRWLAYLAVEGVAWIVFGRAQWSATKERGQYRDLAWNVARSFDGPRVDGDFPYYESMEKVLASGAFDTDPTAPDARTFSMDS